MPLSQEDKDWFGARIDAALANQIIPQTEENWTRFAVRDAQGELVPIRTALQTIYRKVVAGVDVNVDDAALVKGVADEIDRRARERLG